MSPLPKRMKQTDIRTSLSRINQTAGTHVAEDASQASDTVQDKVPKKKIAVAVEISKDQQQEHKELQFRLNSETYSVGFDDPSMTVLDALNKSPSFRKENKKLKNKDKQVLLLRSKDQMPRAAVRTDFPCCLIDNDEIIDVSFMKTDGSASVEQMTKTSLPSNPDELVTFFVKKRGGDKVVHLLKSKALRARVDYVCVYAQKEEKLKKALKRDGRFTKKMFQKHCALSEFGTEIRHEMSKRVKHLDQKAFTVIVLSDNEQPDSQEDFTPSVKTEPGASGADVADDAGTNQTPNTEQETKQKKKPEKSTRSSARWSAPKEIPNSEEILQLLRDQHKDLLEQLKHRENLKKSQLQNFFREEFAKSVQSYLEVKKVKMLAVLSDAVCQIRVEGSPEGTGFLLFDRYVLTNAHVIEPFTSRIQVDPYPLIHLQKTVTAVFNFEDYQSKLIEVSVKKEVFALAYGRDSKGRHLDYALLELEIDALTNNTDPPADIPQLLRRHSFSPLRAGSQICIVGHPGEGVMKVDPCFILKRESEQRSTNDPFHVITQEYLENVEENQIPYHSCFFHGSSGSPVFDEDCYLIGIHTGGFTDKEKGRILEFGYSLEPILENIKMHAENKEENIRNKILSILEEHDDISCT